MKVFLAVLILIFSLQSLSKAEGISEFEIEGMSIGDSLLDYYPEKLIKNKLLKPGITYENSNFVRLFFKNANFENYEYIGITIKDNNNDFIIHAVAGMIDDDNHDVCLKKKIEIEKEMKSQFSNADIREWDKISAQDKSGKSKIFGTSFDLNSGTASVICYLFTKESKIKSGLDVSVKSKKFNEYLRNR